MPRQNRKATDQGDATGQAGLGSAYAAGLGVPKDETEVYKWYVLAREGGSYDAREALPRLEKKLTS